MSPGAAASRTGGSGQARTPARPPEHHHAPNAIAAAGWKLVDGADLQERLARLEARLK
jgi:hypothetical protein